ncbi:MAG: bifunctional UDP-N-acetylglucosamine diphosphorylase/glucosamine-1-phosphate N-acetyltransferase GlmU [Alphaproteobacteria bacterium]
MTKTALACIVLAAGRGTRMRSDLPKVLHPLAGLPMLGHVLKAAAALTPERTVVVTGPGMEDVAKFAAPHDTVTQKMQQGTADAVLAAQSKLKDFSGEVLVLYGDTPLVTASALQKLRDARQAADAAVVVAAFEAEEPAAYGRVVTDEDGQVTAIVEALDATPEQKTIRLCNAGMMLMKSPLMWDLLAAIDNNNAKREYYLTDAVSLARERGLKTAHAEIPAEAALGINDRVELAALEHIMQQRLREKAMRGGATLQDPQTVYFSHDTAIGRDVTVGANVIFAPGVTVEDGAQIRAFCHLEEARVGKGAIVGPFARLRPGTDLGAGAHVGNFVEIKKSAVGAGTKINHLTYIGDAEIGAGANIGAGTITCNYDGFRKHRTSIGDGAFIGSNTALVAPVEIGAGAFIGAGSVITDNVPPGTLAVARGRQVNFENWARKIRGEKKDKP